MKAFNLMEIIISKPTRAYEGPSSIIDVRCKVCKVKSEKCEVFLSWEASKRKGRNTLIINTDLSHSLFYYLCFQNWTVFSWCSPSSSGLIFILTSELGLGLELNNQSAILTDVDPDYLQPGWEDAVRLNPCVVQKEQSHCGGQVAQQSSHGDSQP